MAGTLSRERSGVIRARITVMPKDGVLDPQGKAVETALGRLGFAGVSGVRQGKIIEVTLEGDDRRAAAAQVEDMCARLLANPVIESWRVDLE